ncbi:unnamed protein product [Tetraodon nigroviridis]|nr:unnamed protein product [Tetraodon nigroviridis]
MWISTPSVGISLLCVFFTVNLIVLSFLIYTIRTIKSQSDNAGTTRQRLDQQWEDGLNVYSAVTFMLVKAERRNEDKETERQRIYAAVKAFGLD